MLFVGTHERQLDDKGRLALPPQFRNHLGERCYLVLGSGQCIDVVPAEAFEQRAADLVARQARGEISMHHLRAVSASASPVTFDKQGRIPVNEQMRSYAGLEVGHPVVITGSFHFVELWQPERFRRSQDLGTTELAGATF